MFVGLGFRCGYRIDNVACGDDSVLVVIMPTIQTIVFG